MSDGAAAVAFRRFVLVALLGLPAAGCAARSAGDAAARGPYCEFVIHNQTTSPVEVRLARSSMSTVPIGTLGGGELMHHRVPCAQRHVLVLGVEIPWQVGAPRRFGVVYGEAELVEGARVRVELQFP